MPGPDQLDRFGRALVPVIGVLLAAGGLGVVTHDAGTEAADTGESTMSTTTDPADPTVTVAGDPRAEGVVADPTATSSGSGAPASTNTTTTTAPLGRAVVPASGTYRYEIDSLSDGESSSRVETREFSVVGESDGVSTIQVVAASDGERQVSVFDWSSAGALVRSTRIEIDGQTSQDCTWDPPFVEFGPLEVSAVWSVDSRCTTEVAGLPTEFVVTGGGGVTAEVEVLHAGTSVRAWQVERSRTTVITATVGGDTVEQRVQETGTFFVDPARGLVLRSDVSVALSGAQQGETRRTSVLVE
ncbi:MAG: hypothetical protein OSA99_07980 [Acidimicrobiales bacterium]|nr:hypothetical protein [Acidimicrobiales bacterium]